MTVARSEPVLAVVDAALESSASSPPVGADLVRALDRLAYAAVGATARALVATPAADLTLTQWRVLALLHQVDEPLRLGDVAAALGTSMPSASRLIDRLQRRRLVDSVADALDRRARCISLTPPGAAVVGLVLENRRSLIAAVVAAFDVAPPSTTWAVDRLADALDEAGREGARVSAAVSDGP